MPTYEHYVAELFCPGGAPRKKQLEKTRFTHMYKGAVL